MGSPASREDTARISGPIIGILLNGFAIALRAPFGMSLDAFAPKFLMGVVTFAAVERAPWATCPALD